MTGTPDSKVNPEKTSLFSEYKHNRPLTSCHWEPQARFVFFGAEDNLIHRYPVGGGAAIKLAAHDSWVRGMCSSPDGQFLYTGGYDGRLVYWPALVDQPQPVRAIDAHHGWIRAVAASRNGQFVATCGNDRLIKIWETTTGNLIRQLSGHQSHVYNVAFSLDSSRILSCDLKGVVNEWSVAAGDIRPLVTVEKLHGYDTTFRADIGGARSIALRSDGGRLALGGIMNVTNAFAGVGEIAIALVDPSAGKLDLVLESKEKVRGTMWGVAHHPDDFWIGLCGGGGGGWFHFWKGDTNHEFFKLKLKNDGRGMSLSPDGKQVAVAHADEHLRIYSLV